MVPFGIPGTGLVRRVILAALCGAAFWGGTRIEEARLAQACRAAGGTTDASGLCHGVK